MTLDMNNDGYVDRKDLLRAIEVSTDTHANVPGARAP